MRPRVQAGKEIDRLQSMPSVIDVDTAIHNLQANKDYEIVKSRLEALMEDEDYDEEFKKPTLAAYTAAYDLIKDAGLKLGARFPKAAIFPTERQGIRLQWSCGERQVRLVVASKKTLPTYLYHQDGESYKSEDNPTAHDLACWLNWLLGA